MRNRGYIEFEKLEKQCWSFVRNINTAINYFLHVLHIIYTHISHRKNLAEQWDLPNTGIFYSKDVASEKTRHPKKVFLACSKVIKVSNSMHGR
jgi:hypothetical protein